MQVSFAIVFFCLLPLALRFLIILPWAKEERVKIDIKRLVCAGTHVRLAADDVTNFFASDDARDNINISADDTNDGRIEIKLGSFPIVVSTGTFPVQPNTTDTDFVNFQLGECHTAPHTRRDTHDAPCPCMPPIQYVLCVRHSTEPIPTNISVHCHLTVHNFVLPRPKPLNVSSTFTVCAESTQTVARRMCAALSRIPLTCLNVAIYVSLVIPPNLTCPSRSSIHSDFVFNEFPPIEN